MEFGNKKVSDFQLRPYLLSIQTASRDILPMDPQSWILGFRINVGANL